MIARLRSGRTERSSMAGVLHLLAPFYLRICLLALVAIGSALANGLVPLAVGRFLDSLTQASGSPELSIAFLGQWIAVQILALLCDSYGDWRSRKLSVDISLHISTDSLSHLLRLPISYHRRVSANADLRKITEASSFVSQAVRAVTSVTPQLLSIAIGIAMVIMISPLLSVILIAATTFYAAILFATFQIAGTKDQRVRDGFVEGWSEATAAVNLVEVVKQATAEDHEVAALRETFLTRLRDSWYLLERRWNRTSLVQRGVTFICQVAIFWLGIDEIRSGRLTLGELVALMGYTMMLIGPLASLGPSWEAIQSGRTSARQLQSILGSEEEIYSPERVDPLTAPFGEVRFEQVRFSYDAASKDALTDLNCVIQPGTKVAIVGQSGAGKSTFVSLLSGYHFPTAGRVLVGGVDTRHHNLTALRGQIAVVPQDVLLFNRSIRDNIIYGTFEAGEEQFLNAVRIAKVDEFVGGLSKGFDTLVGERGTMLSVGQKQRIAIARAVLRNPSIFVFDEPTSALDSQTEMLVADALQGAMKGRTSFIVAHRLSTVQTADLILVLDQGRICEVGTHESLIEKEGGKYRAFQYAHRFDRPADGVSV